jgi:GNAT superfamily N-acetyltransferase
MQNCYVDKAHNAIADLVRPGELTENWTVTRINVPMRHRGQGYGTALLKRILFDADVGGVTLQLEPQPSDGLSYRQLVEWYRRHGFEFVRTGYMARSPKGRIGLVHAE